MLGALFDIPCSGPSPFTLKGPLKFENLSVLQQFDCPTTEFLSLRTVLETTSLNNIIHKLIRANIIPRTGGRSEMTYQDLTLLESCVKTKSKCFPYGGFLTKIFAHFDISFELEEVFQFTEVIDDLIFTNSKLKIGAVNVLSWDIEEDIPDSIALVVSPSHSPTAHSIPHPPDYQNSELHHLL